MSGTFPASPAPAALNLRSIQPTRTSDAHNLSTSARTVGAQRWGFKLSWKARRRPDMMPVIAFALAQRGRADAFLFVPPGFEPQGVATGTPVSLASPQTGASIVTSGWTANVSTILKAGDFVKFSSHSKVYMVTADAVSDPLGNATLTIQPTLRQAINADSLTVHAVPFTVALSADNLDAAFAAPQNGDLDLEFVERF
ncbi:MAG: hypothetical protein PHU46_12235 [Rhodocyclaceae bacterium]|nr:hypothetical protein [Rhodocyclaceae bacterium]